MVYFRIEMGLGHSPKKMDCSATNAMNLDGMSFAMAEAERMQKQARHKTAANYLTAARSLSRFLDNSRWRFADITAAMLQCYQRWLCNRGIRLNTVSAYMRSLRSLYNRAAGNVADNPFTAVFTGNEQTAKRSVTDTPTARAATRPSATPRICTRHIHVQFHGYGNAVCRHCLSEMATDTRRRAALCPA